MKKSPEEKKPISPEEKIFRAFQRVTFMTNRLYCAQDSEAMRHLPGSVRIQAIFAFARGNTSAILAKHTSDTFPEITQQAFKNIAKIG